MIGNHFNTFLCEEEKKGWDNNERKVIKKSAHVKCWR